MRTKHEPTNVWKETTNLTGEQVMALLEFVPNNSYFTYVLPCIFGCAMGSPVSAVIADLVVTNIEERALSTSPVTPRWWRRYVDDSNICLKKTEVQVFHKHLNSIDNNIHFTICSQSDHGSNGLLSTEHFKTKATYLSFNSLK